MPTLTVLANFNGADGAQPVADLTFDAMGDLFGTTTEGGASNDGTVFEITSTSTGYAASPTTLTSFDGADGAFPFGNLIADTGGDLFGTTNQGGVSPYNGTVFELANTTTGYASTPTTLVSFNGNDGSAPFGSLISDKAGDIFGTTNFSGPNGYGTVFEIANTATGYASTPTTLVGFNATDGSTLYGSLIFDSTGDLFGMTAVGGLHGDGTVFEIAKTAAGFADRPITLVNFDGNDGAEPAGSLIADKHGNLFGTTTGRGGTNDGTVFEIAKTAAGYAHTPTVLVSFDGITGSEPFGSLIIDANGDLFGTTNGDDSFGRGTVFEIANTATGYASTPTVLVNFDGSDGGNPAGSLVVDPNGDLFGTTAGGGTDGGGTVFEITDSGFVTPLCFLAGTTIATPLGEQPVERLAAGDMVVTLGGAIRRVTWVGVGRVLVTRGRRSVATPVIVRKGALADNVPHRDLRVTKAHGLYIDDVLIPVEYLVNHRSVLWDDHAQEVGLYHVELETHDILLANGAPAESYRDDGNRWLFRNANDGGHLPRQEACAPVLTGGIVVDTVWRRLLERSGPRLGLPTTDDPDLHLVVDGQRLNANACVGERHTFRLQSCPSTVRIVSRAGVPAELGLTRDSRCLGVALRRMTVSNRAQVRTVGAADALLTNGFHGFEADNGIRWTDGDAVIPACLFDGLAGPVEIALILGGRTRFLDEGATRGRDADQKVGCYMGARQR